MFHSGTVKLFNRLLQVWGLVYFGDTLFRLQMCFGNFMEVVRKGSLAIRTMFIDNNAARFVGTLSPLLEPEPPYEFFGFADRM